MRVTVRQLKRIISEAMGDEAMGDEAMTGGMPDPARRDGMSWKMPYGYAGHIESLSVVEPFHAASGDTPSVGAQILALWLRFQDEPQGRGPRADEMLRNPGRTGGLRGLFREFLNNPNSGTATFPLEAAFDAFTVLPLGGDPSARARAADEAYKAYATTDERRANEAARARSAARSAPRPSAAAPPSVATESLRRDLRRRLRSL